MTRPDDWTKTHVDVVDMELYAIALVCQRLGIPWRSFKFITDKANATAKADWRKHVRSGQKQFLEILKKDYPKAFLVAAP